MNVDHQENTVLTSDYSHICRLFLWFFSAKNQAESRHFCMGEARSRTFTDGL